MSAAVKTIYDLDGNVIMVGTESEWRRSAQQRERARKKAILANLRKERRQVKPLLELRR